MSSLLYQRLGITAGEMLDITVDTFDLDDDVTAITIHRGGGLSRHQPATCTIETVAYIPPRTGTLVTVNLHPDNVAGLAAKVYQPAAAIQNRWHGRLATQKARDTDRGVIGTTLASASWSSVLRRAPGAWTPTTDALSAGLANLLSPTWAPHLTVTWSGDADTWPADPNREPLTPADYLALLESRLYFLDELRGGGLRIRALNAWESAATAAAADTWPLARDHCLTPALWEQPGDIPTEYELTLLNPSGNQTTIYTAPGGIPTGTVRSEDVDWTGTIAQTEQWRRIYGRRSETQSTYWRLPTISVPLDRLISSPFENDRRAAGMLLALNVGDPIPLAGDWPPALTGLHICTSLDETISPAGWSLDVGLAPHLQVAGLDSPAIKPRTWAQSRGTWTAASDATWTEGPAQ